jgi:hypothetical protein
MPNLNVARSIEMLAVGRRALPARCTVDRRCEHHTKNLDGKGRLRDGIVSHRRSLLHKLLELCSIEQGMRMNLSVSFRPWEEMNLLCDSFSQYIITQEQRRY